MMSCMFRPFVAENRAFPALWRWHSPIDSADEALVRPFTRFQTGVLPRATLDESDSLSGFGTFFLSLNSPTRLALVVSPFHLVLSF